MKRILLVDDDFMLRTSLADILADSGYEVSEATNGNQGLAALEREPFDLVVLDILMPERDGLETIREIRKRWLTLPVLAISAGDATGRSDYLGVAAQFGANETMAKPFPPTRLLERVARLVAGPRN